jgi:hypothetical protein
MSLFRARCPVEDRERRWIERMLGWCRTEFGPHLFNAPVVTPTPEFFPGAYHGSEGDARVLVDMVRGRLSIDFTELAVQFYGFDGKDERPGMERGGRSVAGHYQIRDGRGQIAVGFEDSADPRRLVAVAAHELCHHKLLFHGHASARDADHEPLTDLATVFFGFGVFNANASFEFSSNRAGWQARRLGYMTQPMFGYALACHAAMRGESDPEWARHLTTNPRGYLRQGLRFLAENPSAGVR